MAENLPPRMDQVDAERLAVLLADALRPIEVAMEHLGYSPEVVARELEHALRFEAGRRAPGVTP